MIELAPAIPEVVLACGAMLMLMFGVFLGERSSRFVNSWCVLVLVAAAAALIAVPVGQHALFSGSFVLDDFARFLKMLTLIGSAGALVLSLDWLAAERQQRFEYGALFLLSTLGMLVLISAADLIALYLGLEMMSLALYVVDRSGAEIFCPRRAVVRHAALRRVADLRVHRHDRVCRHRARH
jgi:NADH-quinone oxidoreductase subunit N